MSKKNVEDTYQKLTLLEQILLRPDTYIGGIESYESCQWVYNSIEKKMEYRLIKYIPGIFKIFDEILVNASDNYVRDKKMKVIKVKIDPEKNKISIYNDGKGIPVVIHKIHKIYVAELIFGNLLTSSNYDDTEKKITGGRNGYGAKLTNIFSTKFKVKHASSSEQLVYRQTFKKNMMEKTEPIIKKYLDDDFTKITFWPDLKRFNLSKLDEDIVALMKKRVYDIAGITPQSVKVFLNNEEIKIRGFRDYMNMYLNLTERKDEEEEDIYFEKGRWQVGIGVSEGEFAQVSFVNGICTTKGGTHVTYLADQVVTYLHEIIVKKEKDLKNIKANQIKPHLWIFVNCLIENPTFDSQTKENLTLKNSEFGSDCQIPEKILKKILTSEIYERIVDMANAKENLKLKKLGGKKKTSKIRTLEKLEDADKAGSKEANKCLLILTEGDSAKALAMKGLEVIGREYFGVFPLRGKVLNVRDAPKNAIMTNKEIEHIVQILGLQFHEKYSDQRENLRYGGILIMTDQDLDGSHIKGLLINFIHHFWPSLININNFIFEFITPLLKARKKVKGKIVSEVPFYTFQEYEQWLRNNPNNGMEIKYYKGLGTNEDWEAQEYFMAINRHRKKFIKQDKNDDDAIDLAFNRKRAGDRKRWLETYSINNYLDSNEKIVRYSDFINKEFIAFSNYDNIRCIPSVIDGFKPSQRKILYAAFHKNLVNELKVAQFCGYVAEKTMYHHGEQSLAGAIIGMAQRFVGSNNIHLLMPNGQFGTRAEGGKDASSPRYIYTCLNPITRYIFQKEDDDILKYLIDEGEKIEPEWFVPIIPNVLINGVEGIGTGWSTKIPCYNPKDLISNIKRMLRGEEPIKMIPWYRNFIGEIYPDEKVFICRGKYK